MLVLTQNKGPVERPALVWFLALYQSILKEQGPYCILFQAIPGEPSQMLDEPSDSC
jgi:hypothetical protein